MATVTYDALPLEPIYHYDETVVFIGSGDVAGDEFCTYARGKTVIAADGGANQARNYGIEPDIIIGDFDSIADNDSFDVQKVLIKDQSTTDLQKLLKVVSAPSVLGFGFLGARLDHSLASLYAIAQQDVSPVILIDTHDAVLHCCGDFTFMLPAGARISIWSYGVQHFVGSEGLEWSLDSLVFGANKGLGTSNRAIAGLGLIEIKILAGVGDGYYIMIAGKNAEHLILTL